MNAPPYFKLGLFVLIGVALLVATIVTLGAGSLLAKTVHAETYVDESVTGLEPGSAVKYRGVTVGQVKSIRFISAKYPIAEQKQELARKILIEMSLNTDVVSEFGEAAISKMVQEGLRARIMLSGITGSAYIGLDFFDPKTNPPAAIDWKPEGLYVPSVPSTMTQIVSTIERLASDLQQANLPAVIRRFDTLLADADKSVNELKIAEIREQAVALLSEVRGTNARVKQLLEDPKLLAAIHDLPDITGRLQSTVARADEILHDKRLDQILAGLSDAATSAGPVAADARRFMRDMRSLVASQQDDLRSIVTDLKGTIANLNAVTEDAKANPSRLILGQPPARKKPGE